jgi:hypothetical protein
METRQRRHTLIVGLAAWLVTLPAWSETYHLTLPANAPSAVRFGAAEMAQSLAEAGHRAGRTGVAISVTTVGPGGPEAFAIQRRGSAVRVVGGDAVGAMYGLMELGEQGIEGAGSGLLSAVKPMIRRPYLPIRGDSPTLTLESDGKLPAVLSDRAFWRSYVARLAHGRFNLLHLHGVVDPATGKGASLLSRLAPPAGTPDTEAKRVVTALRDLAGICRDRGLRLAITDDYPETGDPAATAAAGSPVSG